MIQIVIPHSSPINIIMSLSHLSLFSVCPHPFYSPSPAPDPISCPLAPLLWPGAQKCGTTSLYEYISQHPLVLKGKRRETHFFDWRWNAQMVTPKAQREYCQPFTSFPPSFPKLLLTGSSADLNFFHADALRKHPSIITGESTPSYLLHRSLLLFLCLCFCFCLFSYSSLSLSHTHTLSLFTLLSLSNIVIPRMKTVFSGLPIKFLVMLRDPVARAYSQFQMTIDTTGTPEQLKLRGLGSYSGKTFEEIIETEIAACEQAGITVCVSPVLQTCSLILSLSLSPVTLVLSFSQSVSFSISLIRVMKSSKRRCSLRFRCNMGDTQSFFVDSMLFNFNHG
jgi:hypothetical protein